MPSDKKKNESVESYIKNYPKRWIRANFDPQKPLNPHNFAYGSLPYYMLGGTRWAVKTI